MPRTRMGGYRGLADVARPRRRGCGCARGNGRAGYHTRLARVVPGSVPTNRDNRMPSVKVRENEPFEFALRRFKRTCEKAGVLAETRKREFYEKPTQERKRKAAAAVKRQAAPHLARRHQAPAPVLIAPAAEPRRRPRPSSRTSRSRPRRKRRRLFAFLQCPTMQCRQGIRHEPQERSSPTT